jgi:hypothetical protein
MMYMDLYPITLYDIKVLSLVVFQINTSRSIKYSPDDVVSENSQVFQTPCLQHPEKIMDNCILKFLISINIIYAYSSFIHKCKHNIVILHNLKKLTIYDRYLSNESIQYCCIIFMATQ